MDAVHRKEKRSTVDRRMRPPWTASHGLKPDGNPEGDVALCDEATWRAEPGPNLALSRPTKAQSRPNLVDR